MAPAGRVVRVDTFSYDIQQSSQEIANGCWADALKIYDGESASSNEIAELCGTNSKSGIVSTGNSLFLDFKSNGYSNFGGFIIHYSLKGMVFQQYL